MSALAREGLVSRLDDLWGTPAVRRNIDMECVLLGTGGMMPLPHRLLASMALRLNGCLYIFDAGEGTQIGLKRSHWGVRGLRMLAVTHLHADHCLGIPGLMMLKAQMEDPGPLTLVGPPGLETFIRQSQEALEFFLNYPVRFIEWSPQSPELAYQDEQIRLFWHPLQHTRFCLGYRLEELERPGRFDPKRAEALHVPKGPAWGKLQRGESVTNTKGDLIEPGQILGPQRRGRHVAYTVDTRPAKGLYRLCRQADLAFMEGMFLSKDAQHADAKGHMTVVEAARIARRAGVSRAVLIHISPRYHHDELSVLEAEAKGEYAPVVVGKDLDVFSVPLPE